MQTHQGISLIEVLVSLVLLSMMLLALDIMIVTAAHQTKSTYYFAAATQQLNNMRERLTLLGNQDFSSSFTQWNQENKIVLPHGRGNVNGTYPHYQIAIFWGGYSTDTCPQNKIERTGCLQLFVNI